jgi:ATP synthase F1 complex assembly factor 1
MPASLYREMFARGQRYPQFVLPLPRTITAAEEADDILPPEKKQGYEMHLCEWAALPPPPALPGSNTQDGPAPRPSTVLFTPLAEYKLRQEFAQPLLVLTHYTDLAASKGIVLMRGDVTAHENASAAPTGFAAAAAAAARGASEEEQAKLKAPLQAEARMTQQDAQLLVLALQRFYMPPTTKAGEEGAETRAKLLADFHERPEEFDLAALCKAAFLLS